MTHKNHSNLFLETEPVGRLMRKYAVPCIISLLVAALYNIVDQLFIANADYLGSYGNAANTVAFPLTVVALFGAAHESAYYTDFAVHAFRTYLCMMTMATVNKGCFIYLQAMGKAVPSMAISMIREIVFGVGFALLLPWFFGLDGVLYSMPVSDVLTFLIAAVICVRVYRELSCGKSGFRA